MEWELFSNDAIIARNLYR